MKIKLDKIETTGKVNGLGLKRSVLSEHYKEIYFDTDLGCYVVIQENNEGGRYSGQVLLERNQVRCAQVSHTSIPKHQPVGTPETHDTPSGHRKKRTVSGAKEAIAERAASRKGKSTS